MGPPAWVIYIPFSLALLNSVLLRSSELYDPKNWASDQCYYDNPPTVFYQSHEDIGIQTPTVFAHLSAKLVFPGCIWQIIGCLTKAAEVAKTNWAFYISYTGILGVISAVGITKRIHFVQLFRSGHDQIQIPQSIDEKCIFGSCNHDFPADSLRGSYHMSSSSDIV